MQPRKRPRVTSSRPVYHGPIRPLPGSTEAKRVRAEASKPLTQRERAEYGWALEDPDDWPQDISEHVSAEVVEYHKGCIKNSIGAAEDSKEVLDQREADVANAEKALAQAQAALVQAQAALAQAQADRDFAKAQYEADFQASIREWRIYEKFATAQEAAFAAAGLDGLISRRPRASAAASSSQQQ